MAGRGGDPGNEVGKVVEFCGDPGKSCYFVGVDNINFSVRCSEVRSPL